MARAVTAAPPADASARPLRGKVRAHSLVDAVTERLEAAIVDGTLEPGSRLSEQAVAKSLGVSRGPLREAIRRLEGRKLLQRTTNIGVRVVALSTQDIAEILQVQVALQGLACGLAAKNMGDADIADLRQMLERHKRRLAPGEDYDARDVEFHTRIIDGSGNGRLAQLLHEDVLFLLRVHRAKATTSHAMATEVLGEHRQIVAALARRDAAAAERLMRQHVRHARDNTIADWNRSAAPAATDRAPAGRKAAAGKRGAPRAGRVRQI